MRTGTARRVVRRSNVQNQCRWRRWYGLSASHDIERTYQSIMESVAQGVCERPLKKWLWVSNFNIKKGSELPTGHHIQRVPSSWPSQSIPSPEYAVTWVFISTPRCILLPSGSDKLSTPHLENTGGCCWLLYHGHNEPDNHEDSSWRYHDVSRSWLRNELFFLFWPMVFFGNLLYFYCNVEVFVHTLRPTVRPSTLLCRNGWK